MKYLKFQTVVVALAMILSACGAEATPAVNAIDVQNTAVAAAFTMVAETQAAIPTATPLPPTETPSPTPMPTDTETPLPTPDLLSSPTPVPTQVSSNNENNCLGPLRSGAAGPTHRTVIKNKTGGSYILSLQLYIPNAFGECGIISASTGDIGLPSGYWYALAWVTLKDNKQITSEGSFFVQPAQFDKLELCVRKDSIVYMPSC